MSSDAWVDLGTSDFDIEIENGIGASAGAGDLVVRSDSDVVTVYQGASDMDMGTNYERIDVNVSTDGGATWGGPTQVFGAAADATHYTGPRIVLPPSNSDQAHIFGSDGPTCCSGHSVPRTCCAPSGTPGST